MVFVLGIAQFEDESRFWGRVVLGNAFFEDEAVFLGGFVLGIAHFEDRFVFQSGFVPRIAPQLANTPASCSSQAAQAKPKGLLRLARAAVGSRAYKTTVASIAARYFCI